MKKNLPLMLTHLAFGAVMAQTHYGSSAGTQGISYSYFGSFAGNAALNTSYENSFIGASSGRLTTTGFANTAVGSNSLRNNTTGYWNAAIGVSALRQNTTGFSNTATGRMALQANTTGSYNVAIGFNALLLNTDGYANTAIGSRSLYENTSGYGNVATGFEALHSNARGLANTAIGYQALYSSIEGSGNTATGAQSLRVNTGRNNTAIGNHAMASINQGQHNAALGSGALREREGSYNSAVGALSLGDADAIGGCTGSYNSAFGYWSGPVSYEPCDATNTTALGAYTRVTASNQIRLGDTNVTSIGGQVQWSVLSDGRFKREIRKDVAGLDFINQLNPVSYTVDKKAINAFLRIPDSLQIDNGAARKTPTRQIGFVAQEVETVIKKSGYIFSGIEAPQNEGDPYTIRYAEFVVPLVKAVQELSSQVEDLKLQLKKYANEPTSDQQSAMGTGAFLYQNNPNPFSANTEIQMDIPESHRQANLIVYNLEGKQLKNIEVSERGKTVVKISGNELGAGMFLYTLIVDGKVVDTKRLILTK